MVTILSAQVVEQVEVSAKMIRSETLPQLVAEAPAKTVNLVSPSSKRKRQQLLNIYIGLGSGRTGQQASGGYGASDDTYGSSGRTGGGLGGDNTGGRGDDYSSSGRTGGGLGQDDTFGDSSTTGGRSTGRDNEFGTLAPGDLSPQLTTV